MIQLATRPRFRQADLATDVTVDGPHLVIERFDGRAAVSCRLLHNEPGIVWTDGAKQCWKTASLETRCYPIDDVEMQDGYEFEVWLYRRPSGPLTFALDAYGIKGWDYQAPLLYLNADGSSWEPNGRGGERRRPAHVNGSYVAYGYDEGNYEACGGYNFRSGKILHIYRPWAEGANGRREWCDLRMADGRMTITIPDVLLNDPAAYPLYVDPTFGYSGTAASDDNPGSAHLLFKATSNPASNGTLDSVTNKGRIRFSTPDHEAAIYSDTAAAPVNKLASTETGTAYAAGDAEVTTTLSYGSITNATQYWIGTKISGGGGTLDAWIKYDASGGTANFYLRIYSGGDTTAWEATTASYTSLDNEKAYIYGNYTAASIASKSFDPTKATRPASFKPLGDAFRTGKYRSWR